MCEYVNLADWRRCVLKAFLVDECARTGDSFLCLIKLRSICRKLGLVNKLGGA